MSDIESCFSPLKSDSQQERIAYSDPGHRVCSGKTIFIKIECQDLEKCWNYYLEIVHLSFVGRVPTGAGGKPSTWFPPGGLFEPSWMLNKSVILIVLGGILFVCDEKYITGRVLMSSFRIWKNFFDLTSPHWEFLILPVINHFWSKMLNIGCCFSTLKSDSQSKRIADSSPGHRKDHGKLFSSRIYVWISRNWSRR